MTPEPGSLLSLAYDKMLERELRDAAAFQAMFPPGPKVKLSRRRQLAQHIAGWFDAGRYWLGHKISGPCPECDGYY